MSYTEIYAFGKDGNAHLAGEVHNAWRGSMAVWQIMEKRYLPQFYDHGVKTTRMLSGKHGKDDPAREVWALADNLEIPLHERISMFVTFDDCLVKAEDIPKVVRRA